MLSEEEVEWIRSVLILSDRKEIAASFIYQLKVDREREANKYKVRNELDALRIRLGSVTPEELITLASQRVKDKLDKIEGIYIIYNTTREIYYVGQSNNLYKRSSEHFKVRANKPDREIYIDYKYGDNISINLIPLSETKYETLNELEDYGIRAYNSLIPNGYNRNPGTVLDKAIFSKDKYYEVADMLMEEMIERNDLIDLTNDRKRMKYVFYLLKEYKLPDIAEFSYSFIDYIREYQKREKLNKGIREKK